MDTFLEMLGWVVVMVLFCAVGYSMYTRDRRREEDDDDW